MQKGEYFLFNCLIHRILCIFKQFARRNETFIIRLINTGGTSGQNSPDYVVKSEIFNYKIDFLSLEDIFQMYHLIKIYNIFYHLFVIVLEGLFVTAGKEV